jgi:DNA-binding transcriptional LysR family regulator
MIAISAIGPEHVMDLSQPKDFSWIADSCSFSRASESLPVTQSALSRHVTGLNLELEAETN